MSMLAERKVKQKWSLNPRGKAWSEDSSKFGQKMLEKMGWSRGKGLGAKENGITENVKVSYKNDSKGMGYKERNDQWTEHDSNFNALLQQLSGGGETAPAQEIKLASLEKKSQSSRVRVHYKKFTRGKDLSRCSEKDLANIFGKKSLKLDNNTKKPEDTTAKVETVVEPEFTHNSGSMVDYFKKKLPNFGNSTYTVGSNGVLKKAVESESEEDSRVGFGFGYATPEKKRKSEGELSTTPTPKKVKSEISVGLSNPAFDPLYGKVEVSKHLLNTIEEEETAEARPGFGFFENPAEKDHQEIEQSPQINDNTTKKKKKQDKENNSEDSNAKRKKNKKEALDNPNFNAEKSEDSHANNTFEVKRKKTKNYEDNPSFVDSHASEVGYVNGDYEVKRKKKKKKEADESLSVDDSNISEGSQKKKKQKKDSSLALDNPNFSLNSCEDSYVNNDYEVKRRKKKKEANESLSVNHSNISEDSHKKKKQKQDSSLALDNPNFSINSCEDSYVNSDYEVKRKKKKKKEADSSLENSNVSEVGHNSLALDNPNFTVDDCEDSYINRDYEVKRKKKKKKRQEIDNPSFNDSEVSCANGDEVKPEKRDEILEDGDLILNITSTPCPPTETRAESKVPKQKRPVQRRKSVHFNEVVEQRIIPNNEDARSGNDLDEFSKKIDGAQAEIENDLNEAKCRYIGEVGNPDGDDEKLADGGTRLKFKNASFGKSPLWYHKASSSTKSSYKHLIKGDIVLGFNNTNLHEIKGYAVNKSV